MTDNKNSFIYTKMLGLLNIVSSTTLYLYNTLTNNTYYNFVKYKFLYLKNKVFTIAPTENFATKDVNVDSDNLLETSTLLTSNSVQKTLYVDTDIKLDNE